jgi:16S rRNA (guanine1207-N2)-methyltransferase
MDAQSLKRFVNKTTRFEFQNQSLHFYLSQSLFSSASVDDGSRLLLKYVAQEIDLRPCQSLLDIGCGVGTLGLTLKKAYPHLQVAAQERDALALAFTQANARLNQLAEIEVIEGLALQNCTGRTFDLILANLPGKAGEPVLQAIVRQIPTYLTANGKAGIVVVKPLEQAILQALQENGSEIFFHTQTNTYAILLFAGGQKTDYADDPLAMYWRGQQKFTVEGMSYALDVVYNLPDFDSVGYETRLAAKMLEKTEVTSRVLIWNPGQGHLPVMAAQLAKGALTQMTLGSRDGLSLQTAVHNLHLNHIPNPAICQHVPTILEVEGTFDTLLIFPDDDPGVPWSRLLPAACANLLAPGGRTLIVGKTGFIGRMLAENEGLRPLRQKKYHGLRGVWLEKKLVG